MQPPSLPPRFLGAPRVGDRASFTRTLTEGDAAMFIGATWDVNPYHTDDSFVQQTRFGRRIVPGLLTASLLTHMGGLWAFLATEMHVTFEGPVYVGETVTAVAQIAEFNPDKGWVWLDCHVENNSGDIVLRARIRGYPGRHDG